MGKTPTYINIPTSKLQFSVDYNNEIALISLGIECHPTGFYSLDKSQFLWCGNDASL